MKAKSIKGKSAADIESALQQSMADGYQPTLASVFLTNIEDIDAVSKALDAKGIAIFGASTSQKFSEEGIDEDGIIVLLMDMDPANFKIILEEFESPANVHDVVSEVGEAGKNAFDHPAFIIITADLRIPGGIVIKGLLNKAGKDVPVIGGMAGEPDTFNGFVFTNGHKTNWD